MPRRPADDALVTLGKAMRAARERRGVSLRSLAARLGYGHSAFTDYELGRRLPPQDILDGYETLLDATGGLTDLRRAVLTHRATAARGERPVAQLPAAPTVFVGREAELAFLLGLAESAATGERPTAVLIHGQPAVGKTALALTAAHTAVASGKAFDTVLHLELADAARPAGEALHYMLTALGVGEPDIPPSTAGRSGLLRSLLAHHGALIVLDNAADVRQIAPLLPGAGRSLVLITSRRRFSDPAIGHELSLPPLPEEHSTVLLRRLVGGSRCDGEPEAVGDVVAACAGLPLALRIAAHRIVGTPDWPLAHYAGQLRDERRRLAALEVPGGEVRAAFDLSYEAMPDSARTLFRRIALVPGGVVGERDAAELVDTDPGSALADLAGASLLSPTERPGRYRLHDLLRVYAGHRLDLDEPAEVREAVRAKLFTRIIDAAVEAGDGLTPGAGPGYPGGSEAALSHLDEEADAIVDVLAALAKGSGRMPPPRTLGRLVESMAWYCDHRCRWALLRAVGRHGLVLSGRLGDPLLEAVSRNAIGLAYSEGNRPAVAVEHLGKALTAARLAGDWSEEAETLGFLGLATRNLGRYVEASEHHRAALAVHEAHDHVRGTAQELGRLGHSLSLHGEHEEGLAALRRALRVWHELDAPRSAAMARYRLAAVYIHCGRALEGLAEARAARAVFAEVCDTWGVAAADQLTGACEHALGEHSRAAAALREAADLFDRLADRLRQAQTLRVLTFVHEATGATDAARAARLRALSVLSQLEPTPVIDAERAVLESVPGAQAPPFL
ncbi:AAA family ATPase [Phytomonospora sp. NPDC050363]|uniref:AAA family ATPase n=1 Tax=Phytomonospora sp. NPDC050363 TaxID=3155642 RepID=UPI0033D89C9C